MFMRFAPCPAMGRPEIGPLWATVEPVFPESAPKMGIRPNVPHICIFRPRTFSASKGSTGSRFSPPTQSVCARRHPQFSPRAGHRPRPLKVKIEGPWMQSDSLLWEFLVQAAWDHLTERTSHTLPI